MELLPFAVRFCKRRRRAPVGLTVRLQGRILAVGLKAGTLRRLGASRLGRSSGSSSSRVFAEAIEFVNRVADRREENQHPDIEIHFRDTEASLLDVLAARDHRP